MCVRFSVKKHYFNYICVFYAVGFFTPLALSTVDIVFWLNTCGRDILNSDEKLAFQQWWEAGQRGYLGVHAAADTEYDRAIASPLFAFPCHISSVGKN